MKKNEIIHQLVLSSLLEFLTVVFSDKSSGTESNGATITPLSVHPVLRVWCLQTFLVDPVCYAYWLVTRCISVVAVCTGFVPTSIDFRISHSAVVSSHHLKLVRTDCAMSYGVAFFLSKMIDSFLTFSQSCHSVVRITAKRGSFAGSLTLYEGRCRIVKFSINGSAEMINQKQKINFWQKLQSRLLCDIWRQRKPMPVAVSVVFWISGARNSSWKARFVITQWPSKNSFR